MSDTFINQDIGPKIIVIGTGGAGGNAINNMIASNLEGVTFAAANTDAQALKNSKAPLKIQLGLEMTQGLGAGSKAQVGKAAAEETIGELEQILRGSHMVFIAAGMGGGTGTGAAPVIARTAREMGILTVGVVTKPFHFEGLQRMRVAEQGIQELQHHVDTLIIIPNQNLFRLANEQTTFSDAFNMADGVLYSGVRGITDLMVMPGLINLDFADVKTVMSEMGKAMMGTGEASGENRAIAAAEAAISNPLLDEVSMRGARGVLINITGGLDMTLYEVDEAANRIREEVDGDANIIFGSTFDDRMSGTIRVSVVATGIDSNSHPKPQSLPQKTSPEPELAFELNVQEIDRAPIESFMIESSLDVQDILQNPEHDAQEKSLKPTVTPNLTSRQPVQKPEEKPSLWQRLRFGSSKHEETSRVPFEQPVTVRETSFHEDSGEGNTTKDEEDLGIPAFLRRNNKGQP